ncbi:MAG: hypothetical protein KKE17_00105 [Proteobacteria bacterium]|nr:hypothetical protein [Pseudomonadota bacterium]MBU1708387.1 hypothetical protein [Pseudomonadota bacterium]
MKAALRRNHRIQILYLLFCIFLFSLAGCAGLQPEQAPISPVGYYLPVVEDSDFFRFAPIFLVEENNFPVNRIGIPSARITPSGDTKVFVDPRRPALYVQKVFFKTDNAAYTNYIYRIHFEKVPFSHLTGGYNVGLITIVTVNAQKQPVLITSVHTCGCYLNFIPTSYLPQKAFPEAWDISKQRVYGETLPGLLALSESALNRQEQYYLALRKGTHRVMGAGVIGPDPAESNREIFRVPMFPIELLQALPLGETTTGFYDTQGFRKGYVKGSFKPYERLLMSWWAMDWHIGEDKDYGPAETTGTVFYTSLKFWAREESDMWNFPEFLKYWGWNL